MFLEIFHERFSVMLFIFFNQIPLYVFFPVLVQPDAPSLGSRRMAVRAEHETDVFPLLLQLLWFKSVHTWPDNLSDRFLILFPQIFS